MFEENNVQQQEEANLNMNTNVNTEDNEDQESVDNVRQIESDLRYFLKDLTEEFCLEEVVTAFFFVAQEVLDKIGYDVVERKEEAVKDE